MQRIVFGLLLFISLNVLASRAKVDSLCNIALEIEVSDEFNCTVYGIYPKASKVTHLPVSQMARSLEAIDQAQRVLNKNLKTPFLFRMTENGEFNFDNLPLLHHYKKVFSARQRLTIPQAIKLAIEQGNKEFVQEKGVKPSAPKKMSKIDLGFTVNVSADYVYTVHVLYPLSEYATNVELPPLQLFGALAAKDKAQRVLDSGIRQAPFSYNADLLADYDYYDRDDNPNYFTVFAAQGRMKIPQKIREKIEEGNKKFEKEAIMGRK
jgi:hypothetical protein